MILSPSPSTSFISTSESSSNPRARKQKVKESSVWACIFARNLKPDDLGLVSPSHRKILFHSSHGKPGISNQNIWSNGKRLGLFKALHRFFTDIFCSLVVFELQFRCRFSLRYFLSQLTPRSMMSLFLRNSSTEIPLFFHAHLFAEFFSEKAPPLSYNIFILQLEFHSDCRPSLPMPVHERDFLSLLQNSSC